MKKTLIKFVLLLLFGGFTAGCASQRCKCPKIRYEQPGVLPGPLSPLSGLAR